MLYSTIAAMLGYISLPSSGELLGYVLFFRSSVTNIFFFFAGLDPVNRSRLDTEGAGPLVSNYY